jgi:DNA-binding MarR family transcriptional regulator
LAHLAHRRHHELHAALPAELFRNANWTIMLACFSALLEGRTLCVKHIQSLLNQSHTALLRHIDALEKHRLVGRQRDPWDGRRTLVLLSGQGAAAIADYLERCGRDVASPSTLAGPKAFPLRQDHCQAN